MAASGDLRQILGMPRFNTMSTDTQTVLLHVWNTQTGNLKSELEKTKVDAEQKISVLQNKNQELEAKLAVFIEESEKGQSALSLYREQATASGSTAARLTEENGKLAAERDEFQRRFNNAQAERDDIQGLFERRQEEIERLHGKIQELTEEVTRAVSGKSEALARLEDLDTKEINIAFKEKRIKQEKDFLETQNEKLKEEVGKAHEAVLTSKREAGVRQIELTQELAQRTEEMALLAKREESALNDVETYRRRSEQLTERLREARDSESKLEDNYRAELKSQTRLADLYRQQGEENTQKTEELTSAVTNLQQLLAEAGEKCGQLETEIETLKSGHQAQLEARGETAHALRKELEDANRLLKTVKDKGLTEDAMEHLSPSAAQASRLLKSGVTLTGIYTQMVSLSEELTMEKAENQRLNSYMDQILVEIEERAPILRQQREDYEQAMSAVGGLTESLEAAREEVELRRREAEEARGSLNSLEQDRDRLEQQVFDLGRQITRLVKEVEAARCGGQTVEPEQTLDISTTDSVVDGRLLTFKDVSELQQRNIELLAVVRRLGEAREQEESRLIQEKTAEVRQELDTALRQAEELRAARERQQLMVENIIQQRDMYKSMCSSKEVVASSSSSSSTPSKPETETTTPEISKAKVADLEIALAEVRKEFAEYKEDKITNYRMVETECRRLRDELFEARSQSAKLASNEEYNSERFNIAQANCASFKKQIEALEMRNRQLDTIGAKHEISISALRGELLKLGRSLAQAELQADQRDQENMHLKSVEARLTAEVEVLHREKSTTNNIMSNLQLIQNNLERKDDEHRIRLQESNATLSKDLELLRKKLDESQDHFKTSVRTWENTNKELREKADRSEQCSTDALKQLAAMTATLDTMKEELKEKQDELQLAESRLAGRGQLSSQASSVDGEGKNRYRDVEILLGKSKQELKQLNNQLGAERKKVEEFKSLSETAEKRMMESSKAMLDYKNEADGKIKVLEADKVAVEKSAGEAANLVKELKKKIEDLEAEVGTNGGALMEKFRQTSGQLEKTKAQVGQLEEQEAETRQRMKSLAEEAREAQEKYERELVFHAKDIELLNQIKADMSSKLSNMDEIEVERARSASRLVEMKEVFERDSASTLAEVGALREQVDVMGKENQALMNQIESLSVQMTDLSAAGDQTLDTSASQQQQLDVSNVSIRSTHDEDSSREQLMSIIKYLRREKEIVAGRLEVSQAELTRTARQLEHAQKQHQDAQSAYQIERQGTSENLMTAGKHAELIRKVESLAAVTDSNKLLRDEKDRLANIVEAAKDEAEKAKALVLPLETKVAELEDKYGSLLVDKAALQTECEGWKKRSDQLVEKSFKMNPEELKRLQDAEAKLTKMVTGLTAEKNKLTNQVNGILKEVAVSKQSLSTAQQEIKKSKEDLDKKVRDLKALSGKETSQRNQLGNLSKQNNDLKKKVEEAEKLKTDNLALINKLKQDLTTAQGKANEAKTGGEENASLKARMAALEKTSSQATEELNKTKSTIKNLRMLGRQFREKCEKATKDLETVSKEKTELEQKVDQVQTELTGKLEELQSAQSLIESLEPEETQQLIQNLTKRSEELEKTALEKENRAKKVLETAKGKINQLQKQNKELTDLIGTNNEKAMLEECKTEIEQAKAEKEQMKSALESTINAIRKDNQGLKNMLTVLKEEKALQQEQIESLQTELVAAVTQQPAAKPVAVAAGVVHQQESRKQAQPQAHIQPHRHQPRDDQHRPPTQMASVRPMTQQRSGATAAWVLPTSQVLSSGQPEIAMVQPSVSSMGQPTVMGSLQVPSTSSSQQLDPTAAEFSPAAAAAATDRTTTAAASSSAEAVMDAVDDSARVSVLRLDTVQQASTSSPSVSMHSSSAAQTSTGGSTQTTMSVHPTLKRTRDLLADDEVADAAGPSGIQKRSRTVSSTAEVSNMETTAPAASDTRENQNQQEEEEEDIEEEIEEGEEVESMVSSQLGHAPEAAADTGDRSVREGSRPAAAAEEDIEAFAAAEAAMEEGEISEEEEEDDDDDDEEEIAAPDLDVLAEDDTEDQDEDGGEDDGGQGEHGEVEHQGLMEDEEEDDEDQQLQQLVVDEDAENSSSEPSSSTGAATQLLPTQRSQQQFPTTAAAQQASVQQQQQQQTSGFEQDTAEDSVVPSTPKLAEPRRPDGFSEAVSSPQVPNNERFVFGGGSSDSSSVAAVPDLVVTSTGLVGQEGAERTAFDISVFAGDKEARTVPTGAATPQPTSPESVQEDASEAVAEPINEPASADEVPEPDESAAGSREPEEGVSSSGGTEAPARPARKPITWSEPSAAAAAGPASTSPQRSLNRTGIAGTQQFRTAVRGVAKTRGMKRGGGPKP